MANMTKPEAVKNNKKRKFSKANHGQAAKRRKGNGSAAPKGKQQAAPRRVVAADKLEWKAVSVPEMFGDAEGFFGFEEVQGVDIVRDGETIQFVTAAPSAADSDEFQGFDDAPEPSGEAPAADTTESNDKALETKASEAKPAKAGKAKAQDKPKEQKKQKAAKPAADTKEQKKGAKAGAKAAPAEDASLGSSGFALLADMDEGAGDDGADVAAWVPLNLAPPLLSCLARLKFSKPTAIQAAAIPEVLAGHDVIGKASTGSGKTLAFAIPIVQKWLSVGAERERRRQRQAKNQNQNQSSSAGQGPACPPLALVLSPTRELAHQITNHIKELCSALPSGPYVCAVTGGLSVYKQQRQLEKADIVVGTPGRLWEVLSASRPLMEAFRSTAFLVIDEADRLLSEGHFKEAEEILLALDRVEVDEEDEADEETEGEQAGPQKGRQTLVFSATFNKGLQQKLAGKGRYDLMDQAQSMEHLLKRLNFREEDPKFIDVNPVSQMAERLREGLVECGGMEKDLYLYALLLMQRTRRTLVFTNSISSVRRLTPMLQNLNVAALALHSQMPQKARLRSVERFTAAQSNGGAVLIATDVAARGLDIPGIDVVVHYHVPRTADNYVHRSGRTARAESAGQSILLCGPDEVTPTRRLVAKIHAASTAPGKGKDANTSGNTSGSFFIRTIDLDRRLVARLKERVVIAKRLADATLAKEKGNKDDNWLRAAADELGVEYDSDNDGGDGLARAGSWSGRGSGRRNREKEARSLSKAEAASLRAQLRELLSKRINAGVSERYIAAGSVNVEELLKGGTGDFLGTVDGLGLDD